MVALRMQATRPLAESNNSGGIVDAYIVSVYNLVVDSSMPMFSTQYAKTSSLYLNQSQYLFPKTLGNMFSYFWVKPNVSRKRFGKFQVRINVSVTDVFGGMEVLCTMPQQVEKVGWEGSEGGALVGNTSLLLQN